MNDNTENAPANRARNVVTGQAEIAVQTGTIQGGVHLHTGGPQVPIPRQLPAPPRHWINRDHPLAALADDADGPGPALAVISGCSGVGKTALALHSVHSRRSLFPHGQLLAELSAWNPADVLASWLRAVGHPHVPGALTELAPTWRTVTADRAVALIIDDAVDADQVIPLLPSSPRSAVLVTSLHPLPALLAHGARPHYLEPLTPADTTQLIRLYAGEHTVDLDEATADVLTLATGGLPRNALLAAGQLTLPRASGSGPRTFQIHTHPTHEAADMSSTTHELAEMAYRAQPDQGQFLYRRLGDHPSGGLVNGDVAAAMLDSDIPTAIALMNAFHDAGVVDEHSDTWSMPHGIHTHARQRSIAHDDADTQLSSRIRVIHRAYLPALIECDLALNPGPKHYGPAYADIEAELDNGRRQNRFADPDHAMAWFNAHMATLRGLIHQANEDGHFTEAWQLAEASRGGHLLGRYNEWLIDTHQIAAQAAMDCGSPWASVACSRLSWGMCNTGRTQEALDAARTARNLAFDFGDEWARSTALSATGRAHFAAGEYDRALERYLQSLEVAEGIHSPRSVALRFRHIGECHLALCRYDEAREYFESAATRMQAIGFQAGYAMVLILLVDVRIAVGEAETALRDMQTAIGIMHQSGSPAYLADALAAAGRAAEKLGRTRDARDYYTEASHNFDAVSDHDNTDRMTRALNHLQTPPSP